MISIIIPKEIDLQPACINKNRYSVNIFKNGVFKGIIKRLVILHTINVIYKILIKEKIGKILNKTFFFILLFEIILQTNNTIL